MSRVRTQDRRFRGDAWSAALVGPIFLVVAAWFLWGPDFVHLPDATVATIESSSLSTEPRRRIMGDPPAIEVDGVRRTCQDCHRLFAPREDDLADPVMHSHVRLNHGINDRCRNCHYVRDRNRLVLHDGTPISFSQTQLLCAKCHGPIYRDWERGSHGRTGGYWDTTRGPSRRLKCSHCHDPHDPVMEPIVPLPGPRSVMPPAAHGPGGGHQSTNEAARSHP